MSDCSFWSNVWSLYLGLLFIIITIIIVVIIWMLFFGRGGLNLTANASDTMNGNLSINDKSKWYASQPQPIRTRQ